MVYKYFPDGNFEDFSSGRVIYHKAGYPNFPVRLAGEVFSRCIEYSKKKEGLCVYDPCCGSSYTLTVLGFLFNGRIGEIYSSDISEDAVELSRKNLSLLSFSGISSRKDDLRALLNNYNKDSHKDALDSIEKLTELLKTEIRRDVFQTDILNSGGLRDKAFRTDIVFCDVPYNNLVKWSGGILNTSTQINDLLDGIMPVIDANTVIALSHNRAQKLSNPKYSTLERLQAGRRKIEIMKLIV